MVVVEANHICMIYDDHDNIMSVAHKTNSITRSIGRANYLDSCNYVCFIVVY
jgi:hypothetical protein